MSMLALLAVAQTPHSVVTGQQAYTTPGTYSWTCPAGVYSISVVCVGGGGADGVFTVGSSAFNAGGGGELRYKNNIPVTPGNSYTVVVGTWGIYAVYPDVSAPGGFSSFNGTTCKANGGLSGSTSGGSGSGGSGGSGGTGDGGGNGGDGGSGNGSTVDYPGGGAAGGYTGNGGNGYNVGGAAATAGTGDAGAGGNSDQPGANIGILGSGSTRLYGAGTDSGTGEHGAVRIIWPGTTRQFPSTNTGDM